MTKQRTDIKQDVANRIIAAMEAGTPPWRKPWTGGGGAPALPLRHNGEGYRGINVLILWLTAHEKGYASARWMTFKQAKTLGGMVRKGERAARTVYWGTFEKETEAKNGEIETKRSAFAKGFSVFNADQIDGLPETYYVRPDPARDLGTEAVPELDEWFARTGARIETSDDPRAYYLPSSDHIHMPPIRTFHDASGYYGTLAHELTHWTGAKPRLDRLSRHGDRASYAFEELVAEIGACLLGAQLGVEPQFEQSAAYVEGWLDGMRGDKDVIFKAAAEAQKAADFALDLAVPHPAEDEAA